MQPILKIENLHVEAFSKPIIKGLNLTINAGEIHAIMGPNGSGKSTLSFVLTRHPDYTVTQGTIEFFGENLLEMSTEELAWKGLFLSFQYPVSIPGVANSQFIKSAVNATRIKQGLEPLDTVEFLAKIKDFMKKLHMKDELLHRSLNEGFSGGEKKRNEILQMLMLNPKFCILDETDSGLDIDSLKFVAEGICSHRTPDNAFLMITHYKRLLNYVKPDHIHVMANGVILKSGNFELANELEEKGYKWLVENE